MADAKRDEVPLPEKVVVDRHLPTGVVIYAYTDDQLREYGRQCAQAAAPVMPQKVHQAWARVVAWPVRADGLLARDISTVGEWLRSQNLIKE